MLVVTNADGFDGAAAACDDVVLILSRDEVEDGNISDALDRLLNFSDNPTHVRQFEDRLTVAFSGYDDDPRELHQIPEVVSFFRRLSNHWPYWLHFAEKEGGAIGMVFWLLCDVEVLRSSAGMVRFRFKDPEALGTTMMSLFNATNALYEANGIDEERNEHMTEKVMAAFERSGPRG